MQKVAHLESSGTSSSSLYPGCLPSLVFMNWPARVCLASRGGTRRSTRAYAWSTTYPFVIAGCVPSLDEGLLRRMSRVFPSWSRPLFALDLKRTVNGVDLMPSGQNLRFCITSRMMPTSSKYPPRPSVPISSVIDIYRSMSTTTHCNCSN